MDSQICFLHLFSFWVYIWAVIGFFHWIELCADFLGLVFNYFWTECSIIFGPGVQLFRAGCQERAKLEFQHVLYTNNYFGVFK